MAMKKILLLSVLLVLPISAVMAQKGIAASMRELLNDEIFVEGEAAVVIYDLTAGKRIFSHRSGKMMRPASVMKVLTSVAALDTLGAGYVVNTTLSGIAREDGYNMYVKGEMDPLFSERDIIGMAASVPAGTVIDTLFADCSFCDSLYWGPGWSWDDNPSAYQPYLSPLMLCGGAVKVVVSPSSEGERPGFVCTPNSSFYTVVNEAECGNQSLGKLTVTRDWLVDSNVIRISGNCEKEKKTELNMYKSADFFMAVLMEKLDSMGIKVNVVSSGKTPEGAVTVHTVRRSVKDIIEEALIESNNLCAESLLYHMAAYVSRNPASIKRGCAVVESFVKNKLGHESGYNIADGSGLSLYNYVTADMYMSLLRYAYSNPGIRSVIYPRLPLSGVSGTLKNRTKGTPAYKRVHAKTGTVTAVSTLVGYADSKDGHTYAFVLLNNGNMSSKSVRKWQDRVCELLCR